MLTQMACIRWGFNEELKYPIVLKIQTVLGISPKLMRTFANQRVDANSQEVLSALRGVHQTIESKTAATRDGFQIGAR